MIPVPRILAYEREGDASWQCRISRYECTFARPVYPRNEKYWKKKKRRKRRRGKKWANAREESEKDEWGRGKQILLPGIRNRSGSIYEPFNREIVI